MHRQSKISSLINTVQFPYHLWTLSKSARVIKLCLIAVPLSNHRFEGARETELRSVSIPLSVNMIKYVISK